MFRIICPTPACKRYRIRGQVVLLLVFVAASSDLEIPSIPEFTGLILYT